MTMMTFARGDDWEGVYIDGALVTEGHSIDEVEAVRLALAHKVTAVECKECDCNWLHEEGNLPNALTDVKWAA